MEKRFTVETVYEHNSYKILAYKLYCKGKLIAKIENSENLSNHVFSTFIRILLGD